MTSHVTRLLIWPGNDGVVGRLQAGAHEQADALVPYATQVGDVSQELEHFGVGLVVVGVDQHVAMPTTAETIRTVVDISISACSQISSATTYAQDRNQKFISDEGCFLPSLPPLSSLSFSRSFLPFSTLFLPPQSGSQI